MDAKSTRILSMLLLVLFVWSCLGCGSDEDDASDGSGQPVEDDDAAEDDDSADDDDDNDADDDDSQPGFQVGFARTDISPYDYSVKMGGYDTFFISENFCRWSTGVHDPIYATAVAFENPGQEPVILVHLDVVGAIITDIKLIQQGIAEQLTIGPERILVASSHSHGGPDTIGIWGVMLPPITGRVERFMQDMVDGGIQAGVAAYQNRVPATLEVTTGVEADLHENSQAPIDPNAAIDDAMTLLAAYDMDGALIGTLMSWGCHPMVMGRENTLITSDFLGPYYKFMDEEAGGINMFVNTSLGAAVHPTNPFDPSYDPRVGGTWENLDNYGRVLADDVQALLDVTEPLTDYDIHLVSSPVYGELKNPLLWLMGVLDLIPREIPGLGETGESVMTAFSVGEVKFGTVPGELVPNIGLELRGIMGGEHQYVINLGMDWFGYIMTPQQYRNLLYIYFSILSVGPDVGNEVIDVYHQIFDAWPD